MDITIDYHIDKKRKELYLVLHPIAEEVAKKLLKELEEWNGTPNKSKADRGQGKAG